MYGQGEAIVRVGTFIRGVTGRFRFAQGKNDAARKDFGHLP